MKCRYCKHNIWPWQSYYIRPEKKQTREYAVITRPDYDRLVHSGCFFRECYTQEISEIQEVKIR